MKTLQKFEEKELLPISSKQLPPVMAVTVDKLNIKAYFDWVLGRKDLASPSAPKLLRCVSIVVDKQGRIHCMYCPDHWLSHGNKTQFKFSRLGTASVLVPSATSGSDFIWSSAVGSAGFDSTAGASVPGVSDVTTSGAGCSTLVGSVATVFWTSDIAVFVGS